MSRNSKRGRKHSEHLNGPHSPRNRVASHEAQKIVLESIMAFTAQNELKWTHHPGKDISMQAWMERRGRNDHVIPDIKELALINNGKAAAYTTPMLGSKAGQSESDPDDPRLIKVDSDTKVVKV